MSTRRRWVVLLLIALGLLAGVVLYMLVQVTALFALRDQDVVLTRGPYLQNVQRDRITICWETAEPWGGELFVTEDEAPETVSHTWSSTGTRHEVTITGLEPGHTYAYSIGPAMHNQYSGRFTTAPRPGTPFEFAVWGDSRKDMATCEHIADAIVRYDVPMCIHTGDFVSSGPDLLEWGWMFFEPCRLMTRYVVLWPAIGNHELGTSATGLDGREVYRQIFALPGNELYYSFDYGDAHFLVLDSNPDAWADPEQYAFAERDLAATNARWKFVVLHHPVFNAGTGHGSHLEMRRRYCPLFARHSVDMIFAGHEHNYQRSKPIRHENEPAQKRPYVHLISAGGGAPLYELRQDVPWLAYGASRHHVVLIRIEGDVLTGRAMDPDTSTPFDEFAIDKSAPSKDVVSYEQIEREWTEPEQ